MQSANEKREMELLQLRLRKKEEAGWYTAFATLWPLDAASVRLWFDDLQSQS